MCELWIIICLLYQGGGREGSDRIELCGLPPIATRTLTSCFSVAAFRFETHISSAVFSCRAHCLRKEW